MIQALVCIACALAGFIAAKCTRFDRTKKCQHDWEQIWTRELQLTSTARETGNKHIRDVNITLERCSLCDKERAWYLTFDGRANIDAEYIRRKFIDSEPESWSIQWDVDGHEYIAVSVSKETLEVIQRLVLDSGVFQNPPEIKRRRPPEWIT